MLFQSIIKNTNHKFKTGISFQYDDYKELLNSNNFDRTESVPGAFFEYTYNHLDKFNAIVGLRGDYHNEYGSFSFQYWFVGFLLLIVLFKRFSDLK